LPKRRQKRAVIIAGFIALLLFLCLAWLAYSGIRQDRLDRALFLALEESNPSQVTSLLKQGANPNARDRRKDLPLTFITYFRDLFRPYRNTPQGKPALIYAASDRDMTIIGLSVDDCECIKALAAGGANVNVQAENGSTVLISATGNQNEELVAYLLNHGANVNLATYESIPPLSFAASDYTDNPRILDMLLEHGATVNKQDMFGKTALMEAIGADQVNGVKVLLDHGANPNLRDRWGKAALDYATETPWRLNEKHEANKRQILHALKLAGAK
jgi:ankyrin repeat protein